MKREKVKELRNKSGEELDIELKGLKENLAKLQFELKSGKTANIKEIRSIKKEIAVIFTLTNEKRA